MTTGERVFVFSERCSFRGLRGEVKQTRPHLMVLLDGERLAMRFDPKEVVPEAESGRALTNE